MNKLIILILFLISSIIGYYWKSANDEENKENFQNKTIKENYIDIYDKFYSNIYDQLFKSDIKNEYEIYSLKQYAFDKFNKGSINILDLGCGTGNHIKLLTKYNYNCVGIDRSVKMLSIARKNNPSVNLIKGDFHNKSTFNKRQFSHIIALFYTIYYTDNAEKVFKNLNFWLKPKGFLCIHLIHRDKFDPVLEKSSSLIPLYNPQKYTDKRNTKTSLEFNNFKYISDWTFNKSDVQFTEHFLFKKKPINRQNIHKFTVHKVSYYINLAKKNGFKLVKIIDLSPVNHQYNGIYVFKKLYGY